jgi:hypothetical protein
MRFDLPEQAVESGRAASAALPPKDQRYSARPGGDKRLACDVCGHTRTRDERHRLIWESDPGAQLVLAELCRECATVADPLLELYGGFGRDAIKLVQENRAAPQPRTVEPPRVLGYAARGALYLLIAVAAFLLVSLATSH